MSVLLCDVADPVTDLYITPKSASNHPSWTVNTITAKTILTSIHSLGQQDGDVLSRTTLSVFPPETPCHGKLVSELCGASWPHVADYDILKKKQKVFNKYPNVVD